MAKVELIMPKMGESIIEATILRWVKKVGDKIEMDEPILEIATDKVDSEVPSPVNGVLAEILFQENDTVAVGKVIALIETDASAAVSASPSIAEKASDNGNAVSVPAQQTPSKQAEAEQSQPALAHSASASNRFYSPLVKNIAKQEKIAISELDQIPGSGQGGRVTKKDILSYVESGKKGTAGVTSNETANITANKPVAVAPPVNVSTNPQSSGSDEIIEMDRMRKLIADHMVNSKQTAPHVTSFVEADVTNMVNWRNKVKGEFQKKYNENITFTPIFIEAVVKAIRDYPMINVSVDGTKIIVKKNINIGMAAALPSGNLIVPVIKQADYLNLVGLTKTVNDLANRARNNQLKPNEIQEGTFTITNVGTFGNVMGTPIINQPQVAILATGAIRKRPAVLETKDGDVIAIRQMMFLSLSYDHRVVDGSLGGSFLRRIADYLENFDTQRSF